MKILEYESVVRRLKTGNEFLYLREYSFYSSFITEQKWNLC